MGRGKITAGHGARRLRSREDVMREASAGGIPVL